MRHVQPFKRENTNGDQTPLSAVLQQQLLAKPTAGGQYAPAGSDGRTSAVARSESVNADVPRSGEVTTWLLEVLAVATAVEVGVRRR